MVVPVAAAASQAEVCAALEGPGGLAGALGSTAAGAAGSTLTGAASTQVRALHTFQHDL